MDKIQRKACIQAALNNTPNYVIQNANIINVFTGEILLADAALWDDTIIGIGHYRCEHMYDANGAYLCPGLIDAHVHIESSMVIPETFSKMVLPFGTTTVIADPHEIANVCGVAGVKAMADLTENLPLKVWFMLPSCVPATPFENSGASLRAEDLKSLIGLSRVLGLGEVMDYVSAVQCEETMMDKLELFRQGPIDGHAPLVSGSALNAYRIAGPITDHECSNFGEVLEKIRTGMHIILRMGSAVKGIEPIVKEIANRRMPTDMLMLCTDDKHIEDILREGHINYILKNIVSWGISPIDAIRMATINTAKTYGLKSVGAIAPGYKADLVLFEDIKSFKVLDVFTDGKLYEETKYRAPEIPGQLYSSVNVGRLEELSLRLNVSGTTPVIELVENQLLTKRIDIEVPRNNGEFIAGNGLTKLAVIERHHAKGTAGIGIVKGLDIRHGAIASTVAHDSHNIVVAGDNDADMLTAVRFLANCGGGYAVVSRGKILASLPLPVAGIMTDAPAEDVLQRQKALVEAARSLGIQNDCDPLITLSFLALPVIPEIRLTDKGLFDVVKKEFITF